MSERPSHYDRGPARGPRILVVDDHAAVRESLTATLEMSGYAVRSAANGAQALTLCQRDPPALIITDVVMPDADGFELLRWLSDAAIDVPVIMMTGSDVTAGSAYLRYAVCLGAKKSLPKPVQPKLLLATVAEVLTTHGPQPARLVRGGRDHD